VTAPPPRAPPPAALPCPASPPPAALGLNSQPVTRRAAHHAGAERPLRALVTQHDSPLARSEEQRDFTTDELDVTYFGAGGDPDARTAQTEDGEGEADEDADGSEESLALSEAEQLFTVPDFLSTAEKLRAHFDDR